MLDMVAVAGNLTVNVAIESAERYGKANRMISGDARASDPGHMQHPKHWCVSY
jgi:hypothetical protein